MQWCWIHLQLSLAFATQKSGHVLSTPALDRPATHNIRIRLASLDPSYIIIHYYPARQCLRYLLGCGTIVRRINCNLQPERIPWDNTLWENVPPQSCPPFILRRYLVCLRQRSFFRRSLACGRSSLWLRLPVTCPLTASPTETRSKRVVGVPIQDCTMSCRYCPLAGSLLQNHPSERLVRDGF